MKRPDPIPKYLAKNPGLTQAGLAKLCGLSLDTLRSYVGGRRQPGIDNAFAIEKGTRGEIVVAAWRRK